jgi:imidazole glycerol-phosphate synthase subunit HisH
MPVGIVDLGISNVKSVQNMLRKAGSESVISNDHEVLSKCKKIILPGVGAFDAGMRKIDDKGLTNFLKDLASDKSRQLLGICLGMQLLTNSSEEGDLDGLGIVDAVTLKFRRPANLPEFKIPNMGWRETQVHKSHTLLAGIPDWRFYFVHSYFVRCNNSEDVLLTSSHGEPFVAGFSRENIYGVQFHPEKSHRFGLRLLQNFCQKAPA